MTRHKPHTAFVQVHGLEDGLQQLVHDLAQPGPVFAWIFLLELDFARELLAHHCHHSTLFAIIDHRQRGTAKTLQHEYTNFTARSWAYNRTMHEKTFIFEQLGITWLGSQNLTRGSFTMSINRAARIDSPSLCAAMTKHWLEHWKHARAVPR